MIQVQNLSYSFPTKDLYKDVSFEIKAGQHCAFIGSNGTGKTTLVNMILNPEQYLYEGKILLSEECRIGYVNQFFTDKMSQELTVFDFLSERFVENQKKTEEVCAQMETAEDLETLLDEYQQLLDAFQAMDGDNYESNIKKQLHLVGMTSKADTSIRALSGGEYKLLHVMREMLLMPNLLIMDEPDVFLDFENMNGLCSLINSYKGTLLVITHNRYLLNHCFDKILHLEDCDIQEFDGNYISYNFALLQKKIELKEQSMADQEEIERTEKMVARMRTNATVHSIASLGRAVHAKQTYLDRIKERAIKAPFIEMRLPQITFPVILKEDKYTDNGVEIMNAAGGTEGILDTECETVKTEEMPDGQGKTNSSEVVLSVRDYNVSFDEVLLEDVNFELKANEKVAIVGANGTGKTTLFYDIFKNQHPCVEIPETVTVGFLSQFYDAMWDEKNTVYDEFFKLGFETKDEIRIFLKGYYFEEETLKQRIEQLSGGEKNLLQLARIAAGKANLLLLDEPTSHLDTYAQIALEEAINEYQGAILMVSHDFYTIVNCADYILFVDDTSVRRMRIRSFRKKIYENHFNKDYLELEQKKKELETRINTCIKEDDIKTAKVLCEQLEVIIHKMEQIS